MEERFEDIIQEGMSKYLASKGLNLSNANPVQRGNALTEFYIKEIGLYLYNIYEDDIADGLLCDGKGDLNIDFVYKNDKNILILQSKFKGTKNELKSDEISGFFNIHGRITDEDFFLKHGNNKVKEAIGKIDQNTIFSYIFLSNDKATDRIIDEFKRLKTDQEHKYSNVNYEFKSFTDIKKEYKQLVSENETIEGVVTINIEKIYDEHISAYKPAYLDLTELLETENNYQAIICTIKGTTLKHLWDEYKSRLFSYNIRGYLGQNPINKKLEETLEFEPDKFYFYNNGLSAICTEIEPVMHNGIVNQLRCKHFQIINGAQTTSTIAKFRHPNKLQKVRVLLKITKAEDYKKEKGLNKNIITYNNSQSIIKAADFRSNDEIQIFLEKKFPDYPYKGSRPFKNATYLRKRIKVDKRKDTLYISMETLARVLYAYDNDPILIFKGTKHLFDIDEPAGKYWNIFGVNNEETHYYNEAQTNKIVALFYLWTKIEELIKEKSNQLKIAGREDTIEAQALLAKWHILWAYGYVINNHFADKKDIIFRRISTGKLFEKNTNFIEVWFDRVHRTIAKSIEMNYSSEDDNIQSFNLKNWLRNSSDFQKLKAEFKWSKSDYHLENFAD